MTRSLRPYLAVAALAVAAAFVAAPLAHADWQNPAAPYGGVTVGTTATAIPAIPLNGRNTVAIQNLDGQPIYCGTNSSVTVSGATGGWQVAANGGTLTLGVYYNAAAGTVKPYCISAAGTAANAVRYIEAE